MQRRDRAELERFLEAVPGALVRDLEGPAVYQLAPAWATAILCVHCRYIGLVLSLPARPMTWKCPRCGRGARLTPPIEVLAAPRPTDGSRASRLS